MARVTNDDGEGKFKEILVERAVEDKTKLQQAKENCGKKKQTNEVSFCSLKGVDFV